MMRIASLFDWFASRRRHRETVRELLQTEIKTQPRYRLQKAITTISRDRLNGRDATDSAAIAAASLTHAVAKQAIGPIDDDDNRYISGIFAVAFDDYFSRVLDADFDRSVKSALLRVLGKEEFDRSAETILDGYGEMVESDSKVLRAIGVNCQRWYKDPTPERFQKLVEVCTLQATGGEN